jgi:arginyl-tRNA synthetase
MTDSTSNADSERSVTYHNNISGGQVAFGSHNTFTQNNYTADIGRQFRELLADIERQLDELQDQAQARQEIEAIRQQLDGDKRRDIVQNGLSTLERMATTGSAVLELIRKATTLVINFWPF